MKLEEENKTMLSEETLETLMVHHKALVNQAITQNIFNAHEYTHNALFDNALFQESLTMMKDQQRLIELVGRLMRKEIFLSSHIFAIEPHPR